ncbi:MAG: hypothetical protein IT162_18240 [Bryobacterales bacterium]|nr:hypothetical protein [Bryobacterales bacterium]
MSALPRPFPDQSSYRAPSLGEFTTDLGRSLSFRPADVTANRNGFMSTVQFFRLLWIGAKPLRRATVSLCAWLALLHFLTTLFQPRLMRLVLFQNYAIEFITLSLSLAMAFVVAAINVTERSWWLLKDLLSGEVASVEGRLDPAWGEEPAEGLARIRGVKIETYFFDVRQERFEVTAQAYDLLKTKYDDFRPAVRLYFSPRSRLLLSVEPLTVETAASTALDPRLSQMNRPSRD